MFSRLFKYDQRVKMMEEVNQKKNSKPVFYGKYGFLPLVKEPGSAFQQNGGWLGEPSTKMVAPRENQPLIFAIEVPQVGNYTVDVTIKAAAKELKAVRIFTNRRHCVAQLPTLPAGHTHQSHFAVHLGSFYYKVGEQARCDKKIYVALFGLTAISELAEIKVTAATLPTVHIVGDSIVADDEAAVPYVAKATWSGWGQHLEQFLMNCAVNNQSHNGMTTACCRADGHWQIVLDELATGDVVLFHFAHNDQKRSYLTATGGYSANMRRFVREVKARGGVPVLVTSFSRVPQVDQFGVVYDSLEEYATALRQIGLEEQGEVLDLHAKSFAELVTMRTQFDLSRYYKDAAHTNDWGADLVAFWLTSLIAENQASALHSFVNAQKLQEPVVDLEDAEKIELKSEQPIAEATPTLVYRDMALLTAADKAMLQQALALHVIDPCVLYLHPFDNMQRGQFLYAFAPVAKPFAPVPYEGKYADISLHRWIAPFVQAAENAHLWAPETTVADLVRLEDNLLAEELISFVIRNSLELEKRNLSVRECEAIARSRGLLWEGYESNAPVTRLRCYGMIVEVIGNKKIKK